MNLALILQIIAIVPRVQAALKSGASVPSIIKELAPDLLPILSQIGTILFPNVDPDKAAQAGVDAMFDVDGTMWIQETLNKLGQNPPLDVDGEYGVLTKAAVTDYQKKHGDLVVDGWAGPKTTAAMALEAAKL